MNGRGRRMTVLRVLVPIMILAGTFFAALAGPRAVPLPEVDLGSVTQLLATLLLIALLVERSLDVFLTTWRAPGSEALSARITRLKADPTSGGDEIVGESDELQRHRAQTRTIAMWTSMTIGILTSIAGVRSLTGFAGQELLDSLAPAQLALFRFVDILLTGGVIAGGSDGFHKIAEVFRNFLRSSAEAAAERPTGK